MTATRDRSGRSARIGGLVIRILFWNIDERDDLAPLVADLRGLGLGGYTERADINFPFKVRAITRLRSRHFSPTFTNAAGDLTLWRLRPTSGGRDRRLAGT